MVPVLFNFLISGHEPTDTHDLVGLKVDDYHPMDRPGMTTRLLRPFSAIHHGFDRGFRRFAESYRNIVAWAVGAPWLTIGFFVLLMICSLSLFPILGRDFFPTVDAGQMRLHVRCPSGTRIEVTQQYFAKVEQAIREIVGKNQVDTTLDNIGLPYSGMNLSIGDTTTVGTMDGEILVSLKENHTPTAAHMAKLRVELPKRFPDCTFFFQAADIVNQVLNFGQPSPVDIRVVGSDPEKTFALANKIAHDLNAIGGVVDSHVYQVPDVPGLRFDVDRTLAQQVGMTQAKAADSLLVATNSSGQIGPNFWVNPKTGISYALVAQTPSYTLNSLSQLETLPLPISGMTGNKSMTAKSSGQLLMNIASVHRNEVPALISQYNVRPVFDINANIQGRDLYGVSKDIEKVLEKVRSGIPKDEPVKIVLSGQIDTMQQSYSGLFTGMALAVLFVFLLMVINFQSWLSPIIVLLAVPFGLSGVMWGLYLTGTYLSVPALMGGLMCIGLTTANAILVVVFANERLAEGYTATEAAVAAGFTRLRPVLMTALAMIIGMVPMALGLGEGGEQNAPLGRSVIGGLSFATFATLVFVPAIYALFNRRGDKLRSKRSELPQ